MTAAPTTVLPVTVMHRDQMFILISSLHGGHRWLTGRKELLVLWFSMKLGEQERINDTDPVW